MCACVCVQAFSLRLKSARDVSMFTLSLSSIPQLNWSSSFLFHFFCIFIYIEYGIVVVLSRLYSIIHKYPGFSSVLSLRFLVPLGVFALTSPTDNPVCYRFSTRKKKLPYSLTMLSFPVSASSTYTFEPCVEETDKTGCVCVWVCERARGRKVKKHWNSIELCRHFNFFIAHEYLRINIIFCPKLFGFMQPLYMAWERVCTLYMYRCVLYTL